MPAGAEAEKASDSNTPASRPETPAILDAVLIKNLSDIGELSVPWNGRGLAGQAACRAFLEQVGRMWIGVAQRKPGERAEQTLHRGCGAKTEPASPGCAGARP